MRQKEACRFAIRSVRDKVRCRFAQLVEGQSPKTGMVLHDLSVQPGPQVRNFLTTVTAFGWGIIWLTLARQKEFVTVRLRSVHCDELDGQDSFRPEPPLPINLGLTSAALDKHFAG